MLMIGLSRQRGWTSPKVLGPSRGRLQSDVEQSETREHDLRCRKTDDLAIVR